MRRAPGQFQSLLPRQALPGRVRCVMCAIWETSHKYSQELYRPVERKRAMVQCNYEATYVLYVIDFMYLVSAIARSPRFGKSRSASASLIRARERRLRHQWTTMGMPPPTPSAMPLLMAREHQWFVSIGARFFFADRLPPGPLWPALLNGWQARPGGNETWGLRVRQSATVRCCAGRGAHARATAAGSA